jgi:hypothetical protein
MIPKRIIFIGVLLFLYKFFNQETMDLLRYVFTKLDSDIIKIIKTKEFLFSCLLFFISYLIYIYFSNRIITKLNKIYNNQQLKLEINKAFYFNENQSFDELEKNEYTASFEGRTDSDSVIMTNFMKISILNQFSKYLVSIEISLPKESKSALSIFVGREDDINKTLNKNNKFDKIIFHDGEEFLIGSNNNTTKLGNYIFLKNKKYINIQDKETNERYIHKILIAKLENEALFKDNIIQYVFSNKNGNFYMSAKLGWKDTCENLPLMIKLSYDIIKSLNIKFN